MLLPILAAIASVPLEAGTLGYERSNLFMASRIEHHTTKIRNKKPRSQSDRGSYI